ncbi:MAG: AAA family ATPase [Microthrixaceae bacterium]|nr:AAA family ATPase [Microthrixaceae bacterium]
MSIPGVNEAEVQMSTDDGTEHVPDRDDPADASEGGDHTARVAELEEEVAALLRRLQDTPKRVRTLEERLLETKGQLTQAVSQNEKLTYTLREARDHIAALRDEVAKLTQPPSAYATLLGHNDDGTVDVHAAGRKMRVEVSPSVDVEELATGAEVVLNESYNVVMARTPDGAGELVTFKELLADGARALVVGRADEERVAPLADSLRGVPIKAGDNVLMDQRSGLLIERLPRAEVEELVLEEVPDIAYSDIGGLDEQIEMITDAVELPFVHQELFARYELPAPKGILLYGPPGCGKTLIAKAVANSLARKVTEVTGEEARSYFLNIKGPELLNKYVGRPSATSVWCSRELVRRQPTAHPSSCSSTRWNRCSAQGEAASPRTWRRRSFPSSLAEIDGVEALRNVIVIGASNREDLIDPAILRPGRLDVKIKINRPDEEAAQQIFHRYLEPGLPLDPEEVERMGGGDPAKAIDAMIEATVAEMYRTDEANQFPGGDIREWGQGGHVLQGLRFGSDDREHRAAGQEARDQARAWPRRPAASGWDDLVASIHQEYKEHEDLLNTTNPDDWAKISGKKGERITYVRTLVHRHDEDPVGGRSIERIGTGQYL